ncbi:MAG: hypothetical protein LBJ08_07665 [Bifidobacteriaceae bacterium]|nr:hypothetical protein [Bifidobacteriaceae bacterium]
MAPRRDGGVWGRKAPANFTLETAIDVHGVDRRVYEEGTTLFRVTEEIEWPSGRDRVDWKIPESAIVVHTNTYVALAKQEMLGLVESRINSSLVVIESAVDEGAQCASLAGDWQYGERIRLTEDSVNLTVREAENEYNDSSEQVADARDSGETLHDRASAWLRPVATAFLVLDSAGLLAVLAGFLNVDLLRPWTNLLQFTLALFATAAIVVLQVVLAKMAGRGHNAVRYARWLLDYRLIYADKSIGQQAAEAKNRGVREATIKRRGWVRDRQLAALGVVTVLASATIMVRALEVLSGYSLSGFMLWTFYVVFSAAPPLMGLLLYLSDATDGSELSRRLEVLERGLSASLERYSMLMGRAREALQAGQAASARLWDRDINDVLTRVQDRLEEALPGFQFGEAQIGKRPEKIAKRSRQFVVRGDEGVDLTGLGDTISCGIPGGSTLDISLIRGKVEALLELDRRIGDLERELASVPPHPWALEEREDRTGGRAGG